MLDGHSLHQRALFFQAVRSFFVEHNYLEVDTPVRLPVVIPEANIIPIESVDAFLQTSPEMCMKMLMAHGCSQLFQICRCFRKEEIGRYHLQEFCMLEWYHEGRDYRDLMVECEELVSFLAQLPNPWAGVSADGAHLLVGGEIVSLRPPWKRVTVAEAFQAYAGIDVQQALEEERFDKLLVEKVEPQLGCEQPVFLYDYPVQLASLAKSKATDASVAERFELYIAGIEIANGFSELCSPHIQRERFGQELEGIRRQGRRGKMPEFFLDSLAHYPESAGIALGLDRLLMLLTGKADIASVVPLTWSDLGA
ncbi:MAG: EF-P lysine aminoacylase GenX [Desulfobulbus propionicus]|nr:MAG: EF-P lysine aminoacylase GenX [Desulfobulbus propionicus]